MKTSCRITNHLEAIIEQKLLVTQVVKKFPALMDPETHKWITSWIIKVIKPKLLIFLYSEPLVSEVCTTLRSAQNSSVYLSTDSTYA
jgi:hypothetical protein